MHPHTILLNLYKNLDKAQGALGNVVESYGADNQKPVNLFVPVIILILIEGGPNKLLLLLRGRLPGGGIDADWRKCREKEYEWEKLSVMGL